MQPPMGGGIPNFEPSTIWTGDNLHVMRGLNSGCVDMIYLDPPFNSNRNYSAPVGSKAAGAAFKDMWTLKDIDKCEHGELADRTPAAYDLISAVRSVAGKGMQSYLIFMAVRLLEMKRILRDSGSLYLHCDPTAGHYLKLLLDSIFGRRNFRNEVIWTYRRFPSSQRAFQRMHDCIYFYTNSEDYTWNQPYDKQAESTKRAYGDKKQRIVETGRGTRKTITSEEKSPGVRALDHIAIPFLHPNAKERTGFPTQKPLALLERIIKASSNDGDVVLDPFCGCAATLVAAHNLGRKWIGCDLSPLAVKLVNQRILAFDPLFANAINPHDNPKRSDIKKLPNYRTHAHRLFGELEGICYGYGCGELGVSFPFAMFDVDHKLPKSKGGTDHEDNLQLLCRKCNSEKGSKTMPEWKAWRLQKGLPVH